MKLKRVSDFLVESLSDPIVIDIDFAFDADPKNYLGKTYREKITNIIREVLEEGDSLQYIQSFQVVEDRTPSGWPEVEFCCKNVNDCYILLMILWAEDIDTVVEYLFNLLCSLERYQDAFDIVKINYPEIFNFVELKDEFINALKDEDKNFILSIKGIKKFNL